MLCLPLQKLSNPVLRWIRDGIDQRCITADLSKYTNWEEKPGTKVLPGTIYQNFLKSALFDLQNGFYLFFFLQRRIPFRCKLTLLVYVLGGIIALCRHPDFYQLVTSSYYLVLRCRCPRSKPWITSNIIDLCSEVTYFTFPLHRLLVTSPYRTPRVT